MFGHLVAQRIAYLRQEVDRLESLETVGSGVGGGDFTLLGSDVSGPILQVSSIPQTHRHLWCLALGRGSSLLQTESEFIWIINGSQNVEDTCKRFVYGNAFRNSLVTRPGIGCGWHPCAGSTESSSYGMAWILIPDYTETSYVKGVVGYGACIQGGARQGWGGFTQGYFDDTAGVTQVDVQSFVGGGWEGRSGLWIYGMA